MSEPKTMQINNVEYMRVDDIPKNETIEWTGKETIHSRWIGKKVICRSHNEGINAGVVVLADQTGVELKQVRRLYYFKPAKSTFCWYEGVAESGLHSASKISNTTAQKLISEKYSLTLCSDSAFDSIMEKEPHGS